MKLQPKRSVAADLATQKKSQIDEGVRLASKIDILRETVVKEEGTLERFRKETTKRVQIEIDALIRDRDSLKSEVIGLNRQKAEALVPLDLEWDRLRQGQIQLFKDKEHLKDISDGLDEEKRCLAQNKRDMEVETGRITDLKRVASENLVQSEKALESAHKEASRARDRAQTILKSAELREKLVEERETKTEALEASFSGREKKLLKYEQSLIDREKLLKDNYQTLERAKKEIYGRRINRLK